jgi:hypothetical protein
LNHSTSLFCEVFFFFFFFGIGSPNYLPQLALNCGPPNLCLPDSEDNRHKPPEPGSNNIPLLNRSVASKPGNACCIVLSKSQVYPDFTSGPQSLLR